MEDTAYITANPHAETVLENQNMDKRKYTAAARRFYRYGSWNQVGTGDLGLYDPVFSYTSGINLENEDKIDDVTPPRHITDRTISAMRKNDFDRVICHYMQPHYPWISGAIQEEREVQEYERNPVKVKKFGKKKVFNAYLDDLRYVLDDIRLLLNNVDAGEVAISADHGDAFGEYGIFGHDPGRFHPQVRFVPWVTTTAVDKNEYEPKITPQSRRQTSVDDQLEDLGYH